MNTERKKEDFHAIVIFIGMIGCRVGGILCKTLFIAVSYIHVRSRFYYSFLKRILIKLIVTLR